MASNEILILLIVAAILCAIGFYKYVYFLSIGYGFAIAGLGVAIIVLFYPQMQAIHYVQCLLFVLYGVRLSAFLLYREIKNSSYQKTLKTIVKDDSHMPVGVKISIWLSVTVLYVMQVSPVYFRQHNQSADSLLPWVGALVSILAIGIESIADHQKTSQKKENPEMVAMKGLYRIVRCPNYWGEILFWTGVTIGGLTTYQTWYQWMIAILAYVCIFGIMVNGAQRLEKRQMKRYQDSKQYQEYADHTPILLPLVPIYHLNKKGE